MIIYVHHLADRRAFVERPRVNVGKSVGKITDVAHVARRLGVAGRVVRRRRIPRKIEGLTGGGDVMEWRKSSQSGNTNSGDCVEVLLADDAVCVRDSKGDKRQILSFAAGDWRDFISSLKEGKFAG
jgi:hypothetical protein